MKDDDVICFSRRRGSRDLVVASSGSGYKGGDIIDIIFNYFHTKVKRPLAVCNSWWSLRPPP